MTDRVHPSRREFLLQTSATLAAVPLLSPSGSGLAQAQSPAAAASAPALAPLNRFPRMVQEYFVDQVRAAEQRGDALRDQVKTREDAIAYVETVREKIRKCFGPLPEKTPLNPRITGIVERETYRIEKVVFESRPGFFVTANLYVPTGRTGKLPGVVGSCGHSINGKAAEAYQAFAQGLARQGYVCLIFDPIGQGERSQYIHVDKGLRPSGTVNEHLLAGNQQSLVGEFLGTWRAWDGIRALDYLLTRPEVDPAHVGITGNSGGGTLTTWLCGLESRWTMGAPACFVTTFRRNMENELPADTEQCPPDVLAEGLDHSDFIAAMAPKPVVILAQEKDYFDARGAEVAYARLKKLYALLGAEENISLHIGPQEHGYSIENREAMYRWFNKVTGISSAQKEPELIIEKDETLQCTVSGNVSEFSSKTVFQYTSHRAGELAAARKAVSGDDLKSAISEVLSLPPGVPVPDYRILRTNRSRRFPRPAFTTYAVNSEADVMAIVYRLASQAHISRPPQGKGRAILYVSDFSSDAELRDDADLKQIIQNEPNSEVWTCDVRGSGESQPDTCGDNSFLTPYGSDYFYSAHSLMLGRPYAGQKTLDVLSVLELMKHCGRTEVHLVARGRGTIPATFAAVWSDLVRQVTLKNALSSYQDVAQTEMYGWPVSTLVHGILSRFDLTDCYRELAGKSLQQIAPRTAADKT